MGHSGRYELKYVVEESRAQAIADYLRSYLQPSPHNGTGPVAGHSVISLYLDSPDLFLYRQGATGNKNRIKLRIRFYDDDWSHPAFLEIKRRVNDVICKDRAMVTREGARELLNGCWPAPAYFPDASSMLHGKQRGDVHYQFWSLSNTLRARGVLYTSYLREVWEALDDDELRVTFDRQIRGTWYDGSGRLAAPKHGFRPDIPFFPKDGVVMEVKFDNRAPRWLYDLARFFNLERRSVCKYIACVDATGIQWGRRIPQGFEQELTR